MNALQIGTLLIVFAGAFGAVNHIVFRLPSAIGILIVAFVASLCVLGLDALRPDLGVAMEMRRFVADAEFSKTLLEGMLGLLLFAGALHVRVEDLREQAWTIAVMATLGVALSVTVVGFGFHWVTGIPLLVALVFGALISPTESIKSDSPEQDAILQEVVAERSKEHRDLFDEIACNPAFELTPMRMQLALRYNGRKVSAAPRIVRGLRDEARCSGLSTTRRKSEL